MRLTHYVTIPYFVNHEHRKEVNAMSGKKLAPGTRTPRSGQYEEVGPRGGRTGHEVTSTKGHPLPPTNKPGNGFVLTDPTKH